MDGKLRPPTRIRVFAWTTAILGGIGFVRLIPELVGVFPSYDGQYFAVVGVDALVGLVGVGAGLALLRHKPWGWELGAVFWGAASAISAAMLWEMLPESIRSWRRISLSSLMLPREIYYVFSVAASPFGLLRLLTGSPAGRPRASILAIWLGLSALSGALFIVLVVLIPLKAK